MNKLQMKKTIFSALFSSFIVFEIYSFFSDENIVDYEIIYEESDDDYMYFGIISDKKVYICNPDEEDNYKKILCSNDILVIDYRGADKPHFKVLDSYLIKDINEISTITDMLISYEKKYPTDFDRSKDSMINEWLIHNYFYEHNLFIESTKDVDLDNNAEFICKNVKFVRRLKK